MIPQALIEKIRPYYQSQDPGHDWAHILRVVTTAQEIAEQEKANLSVVLPAAYLHDIVNVPKNHPERLRASELAADKAIKLLQEVAYPENTYTAIHHAIVEHSWSRGLKPSSLEAAIVQDADRLDALGAIGILRCAAVNIQMKGSFYNPEDPLAKDRPYDDKSWMIDHYPVKLYKLPESMNTKAARRIADERVVFMRQFVDQLISELPKR